jgi:hypothetical protein
MDAILGVTPAELARRFQEVAGAATGIPVEVAVGPEALGFCNVGARLPRRRRSRLEASRLRDAVAAALERAGLTLCPHALLPRVGGDVEGSIQVRTIEASAFGDASHVATSAPRR